MPDDVITPAESSPASTPTQTSGASDQSTVTAEPSYRQRLDALTFVERKKWRETGQLPEIKKSAAKVGQTPTSAETAPESEPGNTDRINDSQLTAEQRSERDKQNNSRRWNKLQRDMGAKDARIADLERQIAAKSPQAASRPAAPEAISTPTRPKLAEYVAKIGQAQGYSTYEDAVEAHAEAVADWKLDDRDRKKIEESQRSEQDKQRAATKQAFAERTEVMRDKHEDFDQVAFSESLQMNQATVEFVMSRKDGFDVLYFLGKNPKEAERILKLDKADSFAELRAIEKELTKAPPPVKTATEAPPPPQHVGGRATAVDDPIETALKNKDWKTVNRLRNQRDLEKRGVSAGRK